MRGVPCVVTGSKHGSAHSYPKLHVVVLARQAPSLFDPVHDPTVYAVPLAYKKFAGVMYRAKRAHSASNILNNTIPKCP